MSPNRVIALDQLQQFTAVNLLSDPGAIGGPKIVPSCAQITLIWTLPGAKAAHNVLTGRYTGTFAGTPTQCNTILTALSTGAAATGLLSHLATTVAFQGVTIRDIAIPNQALISNSVSGALGTGAGNAVPNEVALVITERTALAGRANRGRMYMPGWVQATVAADNTAIPAAITDLQAWANTVQNALNSAGYQLVIGQPARAAYTGSTGTQHPARPAGSTTVQALQVRDNHFDSQRRRGLK